MKGRKILNLKRRTNKYSDRSIELDAYTQILKQKRTTICQESPHILNINTE
jgi:hypothetical protein